MERHPAARRRGYVLFAVLLVTVVLTLTAYRFTDSMVTENAVAVRTTQQIQAKANAISGIHYAAGLVADPAILAGGLGDLSDNEAAFAGQVVGTDGRNRFSLVNVSEDLNGTGTGEARYPFRYGISDEGGKININALMTKDATGNMLYTALMTLQNQGMTDAIASSIINWVMPSGSLLPNGAGDDYYLGLSPAYQRKAGPLNSVEELLLVQGVTPQLLFGNDRNRNGKLDAGEDDGQEFSRGWSEYLTCYGREINIDSTGQTRINLNGTDMKLLSEQLTAVVGQELSDYILYFRIKGSAVAYTPTLTASQVAAPATQLRELVQAAIDNPSGQMPRKVNSVITVWNTQIPLTRPPPVPSPNGGPPMQQPQPIVACPLNGDALKSVLAKLLDKCTAEDGYEITPRINVNSAPLTVLAALPGVTAEDAANIQKARENLDPTNPDVFTGAWLVTQAQMRPDIFRTLEPYIGGRSWTYRVHSVGYTGAGANDTPNQTNTRGPVSRVEAVIDVAGRTTDGEFLGLPRFLYFRDLTDLGRGFTDLP